MTMDNALAAGQGGSQIVPTNPAKQEVEPAPHAETAPQSHGTRPDDAYRRFAVEELALHLARGSALLERCEQMSKEDRADQVGAVHAAARLMSANAQLAKALAQLALVERRSRTIVETIQRPDPEIAGLNARFLPSQKSEEIQAILERGLRQLLMVQHQKQEQMEALAITSCI
jgi:hypothetical protein